MFYFTVKCRLTNAQYPLYFGFIGQCLIVGKAIMQPRLNDAVGQASLVIDAGWFCVHLWRYFTIDDWLLITDYCPAVVLCA